MMRTCRHAVAALAATLLVSACASIPDAPARVRTRDGAALPIAGSLAGARVSAAAWPSSHWWQDFDDPQLDALITEALASSPSLDAAAARARKAQAQAGLADAARKPVLGGGAGVSGLQLPSTLAPEPIGGKFNLAYLLTLNLRYSPDLWGGARNTWQAAVDLAHASEVDAQAARVTMAANVARTYVALAQAWDAMDIAQADTARSDALVALARQRVSAGVDNAIALDQQQAAAASARQQVHAAGQQIDALRNALAVLVGDGPDRGREIQRPRLATPARGVPSLLPSELIARRADVVAARWRVEAGLRGIDTSRAAFYPSINLSAMAGLAAGHLSQLFSGGSGLFYGGPALSLPIFDGGALRAKLRASQADHDLAVANYNQVLLGALREVADAVQGARALDAQIAAATAARRAAAGAAERLQQRQRAGLANAIDALAARKTVLQLDMQLAALRGARRAAAIDLDQALGGGLPDATAATDSHSPPLPIDTP